MFLRTIELLLPALFPSWRFFKAVAPSPRIEWREVTGPEAQAPPWREVHPRPAHLSVSAMLWRLLWNPGWNGYLYLVSCAEQVVGQTTPGAIDRLHARVADDVGRDSVHVRLVFVHREGDALVKSVDYEAVLDRTAPRA